MFGYAKLPYESRRLLKQARKLHKAASRAERGLWSENVLTTDQESVVYAAARRLRDEAEQAERKALCS
jgi:hypothetical protein